MLLVETAIVLLKDPHRAPSVVDTVMPLMYHLTDPPTGLNHHQPTFTMVLKDPYRAAAVAVDTVMPLMYHPTGPGPTGLNQLLLATFTMYSTISD